MLIIPTFALAKRITPCALWTVHYPEEEKDTFTDLFDKWNDISYLNDFVQQNIVDLNQPFWQGLSIDDAIDQIQDEANDFSDELEGIEFQYPEFQDRKIIDIFESLHNNEIVIKPRETRFRKGKPNFRTPMLRLYGIELEEECIVITGGTIKLTRQMDRPHLQNELRRLKRVQDFLNSQQIYSKEALE